LSEPSPDLRTHSKKEGVLVDGPRCQNLERGVIVPDAQDNASVAAAVNGLIQVAVQ
jgi:hypothetical protein